MSDEKIRIFLVAGEPSGDKIAGRLMHALKERNPNIEFIGVGGLTMQKEGLKSLFPIEELSVMGLAEVLPKIFNLISRINYTAKEIVNSKPDAVVFIDAPDFCFNVAKKVRRKDKSIPLIHYVAPTVWAWREKRAQKIAKFLDHLLALFPFEPPYFEKYGLETTYVGHPVVEKIINPDADKAFRQKYNISATDKILTVLPGSRVGEIKQLLEVFAKSLDIILAKQPHVLIVIPTLPHLKETIIKAFAGKGINPLVVCDDEDKFNSFSASKVAVAASGTVSLELALTGTPHLIAYKVNFISALLAKMVIKTRYFNLVNIIARRPVISELIQERCDVELIAEEALKLIESEDARKAQQHFFLDVMKTIGMGEPMAPSQKAAEAVLNVIQKHTDKTKNG